MSDFSVDTAIIGAGVVGLAIARELSQKNKEVLIIEAEENFGQITSSRNSGVIHAGIYYPEKSLKSKFCVSGNKLLYDFCKKNFVPYKNTKKLLIASSYDQINIIENIKKQAEKNGVENIQKLSKNDVYKLEPLISCEEALLVPSSGIIDVISFMMSLVGHIEDSGGMISYNSKLKKIIIEKNKFKLFIENKGETVISCNEIINSSGIYSSDVAHKIEGLKKNYIPETFFAKGNYFSSNKNYGIKHLIYPIPEGFGLGIHLTLELDGSIKFGPDVEWVNNIDDYKVNINKKNLFAKEILKYFPSFDINMLQPSYAGIRPIINKKDKSMRDFVIQTLNDHEIPNLINLYGIESPGLTSSLAIAKHIADISK